MKKILLLMFFALAILQINAQCPSTYSGKTDFCYGEKIVLQSPDGSSVNWYNSSQELIGTGSQYIYEEMLTYLTPVGTYNFYFEPSGCGLIPIETHIENLPVISMPQNFLMCEDAGFEINILPTGGTLVIKSDQGDFQFPSFNGLNLTGFDPGIYTLEYTYGSANGCINTATSEFEVISVPALIVQDYVFNQGDFIVLSVDGVQPGAIVNWYESAMGNSPVATGNTFVLPNTFSGTYTLYVTQTIIEGCESALQSITVIILPDCDPIPPIVDPAKISIYKGDLVSDRTFTAFSGGAVPNPYFSWTDMNGTVLSVGASFTPPLMDPGIYQYQVREQVLDCGTSAPTTVTFEVKCTENNYTLNSNIIGEEDGFSVMEFSLEPQDISSKGVEWNFDIPNSINEENINSSFVRNQFKRYNAITEVLKLDKIGSYDVFVTIFDSITGCYEELLTQFEVDKCTDSPVPVSSQQTTLSLYGEVQPLVVEGSNVEWFDEEFNRIAEGLSFLPVFNKSGRFVFFARTNNNGCLSEFIPFIINVEALKVSGRVYFDVNTIGIFDETEKTIPYQKIRVKETGTIVSTSSDGTFVFETDTPGDYTIELISRSNDLELISDSVLTLTLSNTNYEIFNKDFRYNVPQINDLNIYVYQSSSAVVGREVNLQICIRNKGLKQYEVPVSISFDDSKAEFVKVSRENHETSGNMVTFTLDSIDVFSYVGVILTLKILPDWQLTGTTFPVYCTVNDGMSDPTPDDNIDSCIVRILNSYDPNDKAVTPTVQEQGYVLMNSELEYKIRFQNKGTAEAQNIYIVDTIEASLDINTFEVVTSSHDMHYSINGRVVTFYFDNIMLPYESQDTLGSNGFVVYNIDPVAGLSDNTKVRNTAHIYFDYNPAVVTNTTLSTYVFVIPAEEVSVKEVYASKTVVWPVPANEVLNVSTSLSDAVNFRIVDIKGVEFVNQTFSKTIVIPVGKLPRGEYFYILTSEGGNDKGKVILK